MRYERPVARAHGDSERRSARVSVSRRAATPAERVLWLQRAIGNAAVTQVLQAEDEHRTGSVQRVLRSPGDRLPEPLRAEMQDRLGADFTDVRVHADGGAHDSAAAVQARAFTSGSHIVFGRGEYSPHTSSGRHLLAHELTHVIQQRSGPVAGTEQGGIRVSNPSDAFERAAEANARRAVRDS